jgi:hypothetical protein
MPMPVLPVEEVLAILAETPREIEMMTAGLNPAHSGRRQPRVSGR